MFTFFSYSDSGHASDKKDKKFTTGYCTFVEGNLVTWRRKKKQDVVFRSSAEAGIEPWLRLPVR